MIATGVFLGGCRTSSLQSNQYRSDYSITVTNESVKIIAGACCDEPTLRLAGKILYGVRLPEGQTRVQSLLAAGASAVIIIEIKYP